MTYLPDLRGCSAGIGREVNLHERPSRPPVCCTSRGPFFLTRQSDSSFGGGAWRARVGGTPSSIGPWRRRSRLRSDFHGHSERMGSIPPPSAKTSYVRLPGPQPIRRSTACCACSGGKFSRISPSKSARCFLSHTCALRLHLSVSE